MGKNLIERLNKGPVLCAEGYLFAMERRGYLQAGAFVPEVVLEHPEVVSQLHREFIRAGSDVVQAFTYYGHREKLRIIGKENKKSLEDSAIELIQLNKIKPKTKLGLVKILNMFTKWRAELKKKKHYELMEIILDESGYSKMLKDKKDLESEGRLENLKELIRGMHDFDNLQSFLEHVALATSIDQDWNGQKINLMTMHAAKGLEFDAVFLPGWEEGLFPHQKSLEEKGDLALEANTESNPYTFKITPKLRKVDDWNI